MARRTRSMGTSTVRGIFRGRSAHMVASAGSEPPREAKRQRRYSDGSDTGRDRDSGHQPAVSVSVSDSSPSLSESSEPRVTLIFPVSSRLLVRKLDRHEILRQLVAELGGRIEPERRAVIG